MPKTPRFVEYQNNDGNTHIVHMYNPRFVGIVNVKDGLTKVDIHDDWGNDDHAALKEICIKMKDWYYFKNK